MAGNLITSVLSLATNLLPSITASANAPSSSSNSKNSEKGRAVEEDLERLMRTLERIKATLYDAEEREIRDCSVKLWLKELKKVAYDAEDVLSEYRYEVTRVQVEARKASQASGAHKRKHMEYVVPIFDGMVDRLKKIRRRFDEIAKDREALQLKESDGVRHLNNKILRPPTSHMMDEASIFGRDAEITEVIDFILSEKEKEKSFSVISIVGKGGLGKTTIAQLVYKDGRVSRCFDLFRWVCVSEEFNVGKLTKAIIESVFEINYSFSELSSLQDKLVETVKGKKILLVLDDVWNEDQTLWELFRVPFQEAKKVRILVTTRNKKVAEVMQTTTCFTPTNLSEDLCWQLFQCYAFSGTSDTLPTHFVDMGRDIMKKCGGLPLAVKSIASLLRHETDEERWIEILESDLWESNPSNDIFQALQISYAHLPPYLKPCFLFCSMYPKDYIFEKMSLIELWISHGYIESRGKRKITQVGFEYYEELKQRSFLDDFSSGRHDECCKLHDIIHDLARLISENEHYSVVINQQLYINEVKVPREVYHLYVGGFNKQLYAIQFQQQNSKGLRTLSMDIRYFSEQLESNFTKCQALRVLELKVCYLTQIPNSIFKLKHLTILSIKSAHSTITIKLPLSIGLLYNLQTLILDCYNLEYLPECIGDLVNLQFISIKSNHIKKLPESLWSVGNLLRLVVKCDHLEEVPLDLRNLRNLHELTIISQQTLTLPNTIGCLSNLEDLNFSSVGDLGYVPHGLVSFPAIKKMTAGLRVRNIAWLKDMKALEGRLSIEGLEKSNLVDAQRANLRNKCKLEALDLCWIHDPDNVLPGVIRYPIFPRVIMYPNLGLRLSIEGLKKSNLVDAQHANLRKKCIFEEKALCSIHDPHGHYFRVRYPDPRLRLGLEAYDDGLVDENDVDFALLQCLQPHPNLKKLQIICCRSATLPLDLQSIQQISLKYCVNIQSLPFGNLHNLKHLSVHYCHSIRDMQLPSQLEELDILGCYSLLVLPFGNLHILKQLQIWACHSIQVLQLEQLSQLKELYILRCDQLELIAGFRNLNMLVVLEISDCSSLQSVMMVELQLVEKSHIGRQSISSLERLKIEYCDLLRVLPDGLIPSGPLCYVHVKGCGFPGLQIRGSELILWNWNLISEACEDGSVGTDDVDFSWLELLQPHSNLMKLRVIMYDSATVPGWTRDIFHLQSIQEVRLEYCANIQSLPLDRNLHTLKHLTMDSCYDNRVLLLEQLPSQLVELHIVGCHNLESISGLGNLNMLVVLEISGCSYLKSVMMDELQLVECTDLFSDSSCTVPHTRGERKSSLTKFIVKNCRSLFVIPIRNLCTLKHLKIENCSSIRVLQLEELSQLEEFHIVWCDQLESITGLGNLNMLAVLEISYCFSLKSLMMDELQLLEKPLIRQHSLSSLTSLVIHNCELLCVLPDGLIPSGPCHVRVHHCGCRDIKRN